MADIGDAIVTPRNLDPRIQEWLEDSDWGSIKIGSKTGLIENISTQDANYFMRTNDSVVLVNSTIGAANIFLPENATKGKRVTIKNLNTTTLTVVADPELIDGALSYDLFSQYDFLEAVYDGENWHIISKYEA